MDKDKLKGSVASELIIVAMETKGKRPTQLSFEEMIDVVADVVNKISAYPVLADSAVRDALSTVLRVGSNMLTTGISGEISEWDLPKTTPLKTKRKIVQEADKWNDVNRRRAIELKNAYDVLSRHCR